MEQVNPQDEEGTGMPVATIRLMVSCQDRGNGVWRHLRKAFYPELKRGDREFDTAVLPDGPPPGAERGGVDPTVVLKKSFPQGVLFKRHRRIAHDDPRFEPEITYSISGDGDEMRQAVSRHSRAMLWGMLNIVRTERDPRYEAAVRTRLFGAAGGEVFRDFLGDERRNRPLVLLSEAGSYPEGFFDWMETDLAGYAHVAELDEGATARLTELLGKEWSCFSGSVRVYHPGWGESDSYDTHPIWRQHKVIPEGQDAGFAKRRFRSELFEELFEKPREWDSREIDALAEGKRALEQRRADLEGELEQAKAALEKATAEIEAHRKEIGERKDEGKRLKQERKELRARLEDRAARPRRTVQAAADWAINMYGDKGKDTLVFDDRVLKGVGELNPDAGPPEEVLHNLATLHEHAREMRKGSLGTDAIAWFKDRMCDASPESKGTLEEFKDRPWVRKGDPDWHMKPNNLQGAEGVRIHFKWEPETGKVRVQWIGRHRKNRLTS